MKYVSSYTIFLGMMYTCIGFVLLTIILILIQSLLIANQSSAQFTIEILRLSLTLLTSIAFEPIFRLLLAFMACYTDSSGQLTMIYAKGKVCWDGEYILHAAIAIITMITYLIFVVIFSQICIESKKADYNVMAQRQGQTSLYYYSFILGSLISYSVLEKPKFTFVIILIQFGLSFIFFYQIQKDVPYYNRMIQRLWLMISGINLWTQVMMLYSYLLENQFLSKTLDAWLIGIPFITAILLQKQFQQIDLLSACFLTNVSSLQIERTCEYILHLFEQSTKNQKAMLLLDGYIQIHKKVCNKLDCVLKRNKRQQRKYNHNAQLLDPSKIILELVNELYQHGVSIHPTCVSLKINYAYFLRDNMKRKQQALNELSLAEKCDPSFDQQFFIYRYQKIIEEQIQKQQQSMKNEKLDLITQKLIRQEQKTFIELIEDSTMEHSSLWSQLLEQVPNLQSIQQQGYKILQSIEKVEKQYQKIMEINSCNIKIHKILSKYYQLILHDDHQAIKFSQEVKKQERRNQQQKQIYDEIEQQDDPLITLSLLKGEKSVILNINKAACSLLGYTKTDLINKQLEFILPHCYVEYNQRLVEYFFEQQEIETNQINQFAERLLMLKSKTGYLVPCYSQSQVMNTTSGFIMISKLRQDAYFKPRCYLLIDHDGKINNATSQCLQLLNLNQFSIRNFTVSSLFPEITIPMDTKMNKSQLITYKQQFVTRRRGSEDSSDVKNPQFTFSFILIQTPYYAQQDDRYQVFGYLLKLDYFVNEQIQYPLLVKKRKQNIGFRFNASTKCYKLEPVESTLSYIESCHGESIILDEQPQQIILFSKKSVQSKKKIQSKHSIYSEMQYGDGIRTLRYHNNRIIEIEEEDSEEEEHSIKKEQESDEKSLQQQIQENNLLISSRSELTALMKDSTLPLVMLKILIFINFLIITTIVVTFIKFESLNSNLYDISTSLNMLLINNLRYSNILKIQSDLQDLRFVHYNILPYTQSTVNGTFEMVNRLELSGEIDELIQHQNYLLANDVQMNSNYESYYKEFNEQMIAMVSVNGDIHYYQFNDVIQQLLSRAVALNNSDLSSFSDSNQNFFYFNYNVFNSVSIFSDVALNYYYYKIFNSTQQLYQTQLYFSIAQICFLVIIFLTIRTFENKHQHSIQDILILFLQIDRKYIKTLIKQTQDYMNALRIIEDNEMDSIDDDINQDYEDYDETDQLSQKKKKFTNFTNKEANKNALYVTSILGIVVFIFTFNFISANIIINDTNSVAPLLNITSFAAGYYRVLDNALREAIWNPQIQLFENEALNTVNQLVDQIYELDATIHILNQQNENSLDQDYNLAFDNIYILDPCPYLDYPIENGIENCQTFYDSILQEGLSLGITKFMEGERYILTKYNAYNSSYHYNLKYNLSQDQFENYRFNLFNLETANNNRIMTKIYIQLCQLYLSEILQNSLSNLYDRLSLQLIITLISFCLFVFIIYVIFWIPHLRSNIQDIYQNRNMITFIPLRKIKQIPKIREYIRIWIKKDVL